MQYKRKEEMGKMNKIKDKAEFITLLLLKHDILVLNDNISEEPPVKATLSITL